jgi:hypothetical protein
MAQTAMRALPVLGFLACAARPAARATEPAGAEPPAAYVAAAPDADAAPPSAPSASAAPALDQSEPVAISPPRRAQAEPPTTARLGRRIPTGHWIFEDGLELEVTQEAGCDFDPSDPCWAGTFRAKGTFKGRTADVEWKTRSTRILGHVVEILRRDEIVVRAGR